MAGIGSFIGGAATDWSDNFNQDRKTKRELLKQEAIHGFRMKEIESRQGREDTRADKRSAHELSLQEIRNKNAMSQRAYTDRLARGRTADDRRHAEASVVETDAEGNVYRGGKPRMVTGPETQYEDPDASLRDLEFGVSEGMLAGMRNEGKRKQLNVGAKAARKPEKPFVIGEKYDPISETTIKQYGIYGPDGKIVSVEQAMGGAGGPPPEAIQMLLDNNTPETRAQFDEIFGPGASDPYAPQGETPEKGGEGKPQAAPSMPPGTYAASEPPPMTMTPYQESPAEIGLSQEGLLSAGGTFNPQQEQTGTDAAMEGYKSLLTDDSMETALQGDKPAAQSLLRRLINIIKNIEASGASFDKPPFIHMKRLQDRLEQIAGK